MDGRDTWLLKYSPSHFLKEVVLEALCTHRPSLLPIEWLSEALGLAQRGRQRPLRAGNLVKLGHLEEVKVVTRFSFRLKLFNLLKPNVGDYKTTTEFGP
jgi:hypothetical protein